jgi:acyl-coenzyme A synthetase/AMP-(fatty) acid ligase
MADQYPSYDTVPAGRLVPPEARPDPLERPGSDVADIPVEVDHALSTHETEVAVTGAPDAERGRAVPAPGTEPDDALRTELRQVATAPHEHPRRIVVMDQLRRDPLGEIVTETLAGRATSGEGAHVG